MACFFSLFTTEQFHSDRDNPLRLKAELALQLLERCRRAEGLHADNAARGTNISVPSQHRSLLDGDARVDAWRQHLITIGLRLVLEDVPRGHGDDAVANPLRRQLFMGLHNKRYLAARRNEDDLGH